MPLTPLERTRKRISQCGCTRSRKCFEHASCDLSLSFSLSWSDHFRSRSFLSLFLSRYTRSHTVLRSFSVNRAQLCTIHPFKVSNPHVDPNCCTQMLLHSMVGGEEVITCPVRVCSPLHRSIHSFPSSNTHSEHSLHFPRGVKQRSVVADPKADHLQRKNWSDSLC